MLKQRYILKATFKIHFNSLLEYILEVNIFHDDVFLAFLHSGFRLPVLVIFIPTKYKNATLPSKELVVNTISILNIHCMDFL